MRRAICVAIVLTGAASAAVAQTSQAGTVSVDAGPILQWLLGVVSAVVSGAIPILVTFVLKKWNLENDQLLKKALIDAATWGAGVGSNWMLTEASNARPVDLKNDAVGMGVQYLNRFFHETIRKLDLKQEDVAKIVDGELGKLLAVDPNVSVSTKLSPA